MYDEKAENRRKNAYQLNITSGPFILSESSSLDLTGRDPSSALSLVIQRKQVNKVWEWHTQPSIGRSVPKIFLPRSWFASKSQLPQKALYAFPGLYTYKNSLRIVSDRALNRPVSCFSPSQ